MKVHCRSWIAAFAACFGIGCGGEVDGAEGAEQAGQAESKEFLPFADMKGAKLTLDRDVVYGRGAVVGAPRLVEATRPHYDGLAVIGRDVVFRCQLLRVSADPNRDLYEARGSVYEISGRGMAVGTGLARIDLLEKGRPAEVRLECSSFYAVVNRASIASHLASGGVARLEFPASAGR